jgi:hypothetical protein
MDRYYRWSSWPIVSIDSIDRYYRYRSIDPSPIVPIYVPCLLNTHGWLLLWVLVQYLSGRARKLILKRSMCALLQNSRKIHETEPQKVLHVLQRIGRKTGKHQHWHCPFVLRATPFHFTSSHSAVCMWREKPVWARKYAMYKSSTGSAYTPPHRQHSPGRSLRRSILQEVLSLNLLYHVYSYCVGLFYSVW